MAARSHWHFALFSFCLFFSSGIGITRTSSEENQDIFSSSEFDTQLDGVPIINPTASGTANPSPMVNPTSPQAPDTMGQTPTTPNTTPTAPNIPMTTPTTTPTTPTPTPTTPSSSGGQWCIASQTASDTALQVALDYACGYGGAECSAIQPGASCYNPNTVRDHASYAFNDYYQKNPAPTSCAFGGTAQFTNNDPSKGNCHYTLPKAQSMSTPTNLSPPSPPSPMTPTTPSMTMPGGATIYGSEPTESPSLATSCSHSLLLVFTTSGLWASLLIANNI